MQAGLMSEVISLWAQVGTTDKFGSVKREWVRKLPAVRAYVTFGTQQLKKEDAEVVMTEQTTFHVRYASAISPDMRIQWRGRWYQITGFRPKPNVGELALTGSILSK